MEFSLDQLEAFVAAVDKGSFSAAARSLGKAQSRVSTAISNLEIDLGVILFDRSGKQPVLTEEGKQLIGTVRKALEQCRKVSSEASDIMVAEQRVLRLAIEELVTPQRIGEALAEFARKFPNIRVAMHWGAIGEVENMILSDTVDMGVAIPPYGLPNEKCSWRQLASFKFYPMVSVSHPLAKLESISADDLASYTQIIAKNREGMSEPEAGVLSEKIWSCDDSRFVAELVRCGVGWAWLCEQQVETVSGRDGIAMLSFPWAPVIPDASYCLYWQKDYPLRTAERWLAERLQECFQKV